MGWFLINILLPLAAPMLVLGILRAFPMPQENRSELKLLLPVKDGQLCWTAIAFSASALYEIGAERSALNAASIGYVQGVAVFIIAASSIVAAGGATFPTSLRRPEDVAPIRHYSTFAFSLFLTVWAAFVRLVVQFGL
jgi:hypothetical protein